MLSANVVDSRCCCCCFVGRGANVRGIGMTDPADMTHTLGHPDECAPGSTRAKPARGVRKQKTEPSDANGVGGRSLRAQTRKAETRIQANQTSGSSGRGDIILFGGIEFFVRPSSIFSTRCALRFRVTSSVCSYVRDTVATRLTTDRVRRETAIWIKRRKNILEWLLCPMTTRLSCANAKWPR